MSLATRDTFLRPCQRRYVEVALPIAGATVRIQSLTELERTTFENSRFGRDGRILPGRLEDSKARLICLCAVDADGKPLLKPGDERHIMDNMDSADSAFLYDACWEHVGFNRILRPEADAKN